jgi:hypothetical protein
MDKSSYYNGDLVGGGPIGLQRSLTEPTKTPDVRLAPGTDDGSRRLSKSNEAPHGAKATYLSSTATEVDDHQAVQRDASAAVESPSFGFVKVQAKLNEDIYTVSTTILCQSFRQATNSRPPIQVFQCLRCSSMV